MPLGKAPCPPLPPLYGPLCMLLFLSESAGFVDFSSFCPSFALTFGIFTLRVVLLVSLPVSTDDWPSLDSNASCSILPAQLSLLNWPCSVCPAHFVLLNLSKSQLMFGCSSYQLVAYTGNATKHVSPHSNINQYTNASISTNMIPCF